MKMHLNILCVIIKMIYKCTSCNYCTRRLCDLRRHEAKIKPCNVKIKESVVYSKDGANVNPSGANVNPSGANVNPSAKHTCLTCLKTFVRLRDYTHHIKKCTGAHALQCEICLKEFSTRQGKKKHNTNVNCKPPSQTIINTTNVTTNNVTNHNTINNYTQNITLNFGKECIKGLCNDQDYDSRMIENIQCGKYALVRSIDDIYFNDKYPKNQTLKKERRNDKMVEILVNGKWEKRLFEDVFNPISSKIQNYHARYFKKLEGKKDYLNALEVKHELRKFGHQMVWYGWKMSMFEDLGYILNQPEDEEEKKRKIRDIFSLLMEKIYERSHDENEHATNDDDSDVASMFEL